MITQALVPLIIERSKNKLAADLLAIIGGIALMAGLSQITISLPWTPVPITGQTFGVALVALSWGSKRALGVMGSYILLGAMGLPIFAKGLSGLSFGPTFGYILGMFIASYVVGVLSDIGWTNSFWKSLAAAYIGSLCIFSVGLFVLSFFIPAKALLISGLMPFIPGDAVKNILAAYISYKSKALGRT